MRPIQRSAKVAEGVYVSRDDQGERVVALRDARGRLLPGSSLWKMARGLAGGKPTSEAGLRAKALGQLQPSARSMRKRRERERAEREAAAQAAAQAEADRLAGLPLSTALNHEQDGGER